MKRIVAYILTLLAVQIGSAQSFEGKITYKNSFKSKLASVKDEQLDTMVGNKTDYYIRNGDYKTLLNGRFLQAQLYISRENKLYSKTSNTDTFQSQDASINPDEVLKTEIKKSVVEVLGYLCEELIMTCKSGVLKYYFNSKWSVDPELFKGHEYGNWYAYLKLSNAIPLKMIVDNLQFTMESVAIEILPLKLEPDGFLLAPDEKTFKTTLNAEHWNKLETNVFKIYFPSSPIKQIQTIKTEIGDLAVLNYTYEVPSVEPDPNILYTVAETEYPDSLIHSDKAEVLDQLFDGAIAGLVNNVQGKLILQSHIQKDGYPGREFKIDFHNGLAFFNVRMFLVKNKMITLQTITYSKNEPNNSIARFMDSLIFNK